ncbi:hypothetical protein AVEN_232155-1 [Araneus ventricosus]|uniref:Uncharacterized protein n=1 Tax=Araneus ventricosus TaxID=182803 RepID=A0A4Y2G0W4_ARAVE|nr:hypothetical protein AVEN_232155-1 [Araneus ventricosus]
MTAFHNANSLTTSHTIPRLLQFPWRIPGPSSSLSPHARTPAAFRSRQSKWSDGYWVRLDTEPSAPHHANSDRFWRVGRSNLRGVEES